MAPLYMLISAQKMVTCLTNNAVLVLDNLISGNPDAPLSISLGTRLGRAASDSTVWQCLSQLMGASLHDIRTNAAKIDNEVQLVLEQVNNLLLRLPFEPQQHSLDAVFAYAIGLVSDMMDIVQMYDTYPCKLPVVGQSSTKRSSVTFSGKFRLTGCSRTTCGQTPALGTRRRTR